MNANTVFLLSEDCFIYLLGSPTEVGIESEQSAIAGCRAPTLMDAGVA